MRLILTHEQADFDALASMLGAFLLDEAALPVLPRRMNRNVRAFVTLYGAELPFLDPRDLPNEPVESVNLVDTQAMATVRGVGDGTRVHIVDHHPRRGDLPPSWTMISEDVGATVTMLVEHLREMDGELTTIQATLMLLGIYEDTGSLTYSRTTSRDLNAASYLLEQGASLTIASDFLNHPLSLSQQAVYDELRSSIQSLDLSGNRILLAHATAQDMDEELSTVAHKLRDLLDPDAMFVLVTTRGGVQLICRSTTDHIDVAEIAAHFGGGGHSRSAASLIKGKSLEEVKSELVSVLPRFVRPAMTVAEIMSRDPQLLAPETSVHEAALRMQRYGYEGYPVVKDGKVIGLLTRRAVDRAIAHKLNLTAHSLMNAGEVTVNPDDSIEHLQRLMTDSGWGQVPVIREEDGAVVGIVTRTDLLKTLTGKLDRSGYPNLAARLQQALPPARLALLKAVADTASEEHTAIYVVGGFVRDLLLERPSLDFDLVVEGDAIALAHALGQRFGGRITTHTRFGTAKWLLSEVCRDLASELGCADAQADLPDFLDLISARTEFYAHPTALPTVERGSIKLDLHRRDFTINTLAMRLDGKHYGELHDYWGGLNDLNQELVRVLHSLSFVDDPTRMLRAIRFEQRFGFHIEERTLQLLGEALNLLDRMTGERIRHELDHILDEDIRLPVLARLHALGLMKAIHPALPWDKEISKRMEALQDLDSTGWLQFMPGAQPQALLRKLAYILWLIQLPDERVEVILSRIKYPSTLIDDVLASCRLYRILPDLSSQKPSQVVSLLDNYPCLAVYANYLAAGDEELRDKTLRYLTDWHHIKPHTTGDDLRALGLPPGPAYRRILDTLRGAWLDGEVSSLQDEQLLLERLAAEAQAGFPG
jgi:tRNA nucleotidyltransferase (CCA-adding enzyme)